MSTVTAVAPSLTIRRRFNAPPARVYAAWTEPAQIARWFGPANVQVIEAVFETRAGGRFHVHATSGADQNHRVSGVVQEAVPGKKVVYTWAWESTPDRQSLVTVEFKPDGDGTLLVLTHEKFFDDGARDRHNAGWTGALDKLDTYLACRSDNMAWTHGHFFWNELMTRDAERDKAFYAKALGWTFDGMPTPDGTYWIAKADGAPIGGLFPIGSPQYAGVPEGWMSYIAVDDVDARVKAAQALGATLMKPIFDVPNVGRIAVLREPGGAGIGWITPA